MEENIQDTKKQDQTQDKDDNGRKKFSISILEIGLIALLVLSLWAYMSPNIMLSKEKKQCTLMQTNAAIITSKILSEYSQHPKALASDVAKKTVNELNASNKNPVKKKNPAYSYMEECEGCINITPDDKLNTIVVLGKDKTDTIIVRTVIQPPSFVTYTRDIDYEARKKNAK